MTNPADEDRIRNALHKLAEQAPTAADLQQRMATRRPTHPSTSRRRYLAGIAVAATFAAATGAALLLAGSHNDNPRQPLTTHVTAFGYTAEIPANWGTGATRCGVTDIAGGVAVVSTSLRCPTPDFLAGLAQATQTPKHQDRYQSLPQVVSGLTVISVVFPRQGVRVLVYAANLEQAQAVAATVRPPDK